MTEQTKAVVIISSVAISAIAVTQIVKGINVANGSISGGINYAIRTTGNAIATDIKAIGIGAGIGVVGALLLPPPFNIAALVVGAGVAIALALQDRRDVTASIDDTGSGNPYIGSF